MTIITKRELLKLSYWGQKEIAQFTGCSVPQAKRTLDYAKAKCKDAGFESPYTNRVFNKYVLDTLGMEIEHLEQTGSLD